MEIVSYVQNIKSLTWFRYSQDLSQLTMSLVMKENNKIKEKKQRSCIFETVTEGYIIYLVFFFKMKWPLKHT